MVILLKSLNSSLKSQNGKPFPHRNISISDSVQSGKVLILAPHPDDEAIGMGGVLSMHLENNDEVTVLYMTNGKGAGNSSGELVAIRRKEAESLGKSSGISQIFWEFDDTCLTNDEVTVSALINVLDQVHPAIIYVPSFFDHHYDHFSANQILIDALKNISPAQLIVAGYEVWDQIPFPNHIVDISRYFEQKSRLLAHYSTPLKATDFIKLCKYRNALHFFLYLDSARKESEGYAEAFCWFDYKTYMELYHQYLKTLKEHHSRLPSHLIDRGLLI